MEQWELKNVIGLSSLLFGTQLDVSKSDRTPT